MRRSSAPSMRKALLQKQQIPSKQEESNPKLSTIPKSSENFSCSAKQEHQISTCKEKQVIFNILWRPVSMKKHKTWKGDGILEIQIQEGRSVGHAVLRDEDGKLMGSSTIFKVEELVEGFEMTIGNKEIELQEEVKNHVEYMEKRKLQGAGQGWGEEDWKETKEPVEKKHKVSTHFSSNLLLSTNNKPKTSDKALVKQNLPTAQPDAEPLLLPKPEETTNPNKRPLQEVRVSAQLLQHLRPHQREGVSFIYACLMGIRNPNYNGCILADEMGLGKTLQCLTVAHTMLKQGPYGGERVIQRVLIVTPSSLTRNWNNEINKWLRMERMYAYVVSAKNSLASYNQAQHVPFVIVSYEMLLSQIEQFSQIEFDLLICDEGHRLKNQATKLVTALLELHINRRILLTGTPVQNNLQEFFGLADFVNPGIFGNYQQFRKYYELPLQMGQSPTASTAVKALAAERSVELNQASERFLLRRLQQINQKYLPTKHEYICFVRPSELQQFMFHKALNWYMNHKDDILKNMNPLQIISVLKTISNHPSLVARIKTPNMFTKALERQLPDWSEIGPFDSSKLEIVQDLLVTTAVERREKCVLVSNHTKCLDMLQGLCDHLELKCLRLDGTMQAAERNSNVNCFNEPIQNEQSPLVFLLSAKAGGVGINLVGASRLILFDNDWNPSTDEQAVARIWRDGQMNDVQIYRLVTAGCIEEKIFQRQVSKLSLGDCVIRKTEKRDESLKFTAEELVDLFSLPEDFSTCQTHATLGCHCHGDGKNLCESGSASDARQIHELSKWQHYGPPFEAELLEELCLSNAPDNLVYVFATKTS